MKIDIISCDTVPERAEIDEILREYYDGIISVSNSLGIRISRAEGEKAAAEYWDEISKFLPPLGRSFLARDDTGRLLGISMFKKVRPDAGEIKRVFVRPEARGMGLGRRLVENSKEAARQMGLRILLADTLYSAKEMQKLFDSTGFRSIEFYPESSAANQSPHHIEDLLFFEKTL